MLIDKFYYIPKDSEINEPVKPLEIYLPIALSKPLKNILNRLHKQKFSQKSLVDHLKLSKGWISKYLRELRDLGLLEISKTNVGKGRFFDITEKGMWYIDP